jgi:hypothetical protein
MKRCPHCNQLLLTATDPRRKSMKLRPKEQKVLDYLYKPRTAEEVADYMGYRIPPYGTLSLLQRLDLVDKEGAHERALSTFVQSGRPMKFDPEYMDYNEQPTVMGVRL